MSFARPTIYSALLLTAWSAGVTLLHASSPKTSTLDDYAPLWSSRVLPAPENVRGIRFSPDGNRIILGGIRDTHVLDARSGETISRIVHSTINTPLWGYTSLPSPDGTKALIPDERGATIRDLSTAEVLARLNTQEQVLGVLFTPDSAAVATTDGGRMTLWDARTGQKLITLPTRRPFGGFDASGSTVWTPGDNSAELWDIKTGARLRSVPLPVSKKKWWYWGDWLISVTLSPDHTKLLSHQRCDGSAGNCDTISLWDVASGALLHSFEGDDHVNSVSFSPDGRLVALAKTANIELYDIATRKPVKLLTGHTCYIQSFAFSPDGTEIASACYVNDGIRIWKIRANEHDVGELRRALSTPASSVIGGETAEERFKLPWDRDGE